MAYCENQDSIRATRVWRERYDEALAIDPGLETYWVGLTGSSKPARWMAQLKNLQASVINPTIGDGRRTRTVYGVEWGTTWGSEIQTDFENPTLMAEDQSGQLPFVYLRNAYEGLTRVMHNCQILTDGSLRFFRPEVTGNSEDDVLAYVRESAGQRCLIVHNLNHQWSRTVSISLVETDSPRVLYDSLSFSLGNGDDSLVSEADNLEVTVRPLQSLVYRLS